MDQSNAVLQICWSRSWGGLEMVTLEACLRLRAQGVRGFAGCRSGSPLAIELEKAGIECLYLDVSHYFAPRAILKLRRFIKAQTVQSIVVHHLKDLWLVRPALMGLAGRRLIGVGHVFLNLK